MTLMMQHRGRIRSVAGLSALLAMAVVQPACAQGYQTSQHADRGGAMSSSAEDMKFRTALAGRQANSVRDITALIQNICALQTWQFSITEKMDNRIAVETSPTLTRQQTGCMTRVIGSSKFRRQ